VHIAKAVETSSDGLKKLGTGSYKCCLAAAARQHAVTPGNERHRKLKKVLGLGGKLIFRHTGELQISDSRISIAIGISRIQ